MLGVELSEPIRKQLLLIDILQTYSYVQENLYRDELRTIITNPIKANLPRQNVVFLKRIDQFY